MTTDIKCKYDHLTYCSCPMCLLDLDNRCTDPGCKFRPVKELTIFEESLTNAGLQAIVTAAATLPKIAKDETGYETVYELSTRLKRVSVAARKKGKAIIKDLKSQFNQAKSKVEQDLQHVLNIIDPIIADTITSRDYMECWIEARKENKARILAAEQEAEAERIRAARQKLLDDEKKEQEAEAERLKLEAIRLKRLEYELNCKASRLSEPEAWTDAEQVLGIQGIDTDEVAPSIIKMVDDLKERAGGYFEDEPPPPADTFAIASASGLESLKNDDSIIENAVEASGITHQTENFSDGPAAIIYSIDPTEKEKQLLEQDRYKITEVKMVACEVVPQLNHLIEQGFESITATKATRRLIESIQAASDTFSAEVAPQEPAPDLTPDITDADYPF